MYIIIGILAGIIILQSIIIWKYQRQVKDICRQLAFLMKHDSNMLIHREFDLGGIGMLSDRLNDLLELRRKEKQYYQEKETLIADTYTNLSHDIRTPLTSLDGYFQLMEACENVEEQRRYLNIIHERIHSLNEMLEELFTYAKLSSQSYEITSEKCCINQILRDMVLSFYQEFKNANITPDISIPEKPIYIWANDMALRRVFQNVLKNVIEHGGKFVCISLIEMNSVIEITFHNDILHDTDIDTARVFDRFYKSDIARSSLSTGLGLSIAKELLDKMNGDISANVNDNIFEIVIKLEK